MKPTARLRFIERTVLMHPFYKSLDEKGNTVQATHTYSVLQQWWEDADFLPGTGEWRDIPLEKEEA